MEEQRRLPKALIEVPKRSCGFSCRTELLTIWHLWTKRELVVLMISMFSLQRSLEPWKYFPSASLLVSNVHVNVRRMTMFDSSFVGCCERGNDKNPKKLHSVVTHGQQGNHVPFISLIINAKNWSKRWGGWPYCDVTWKYGSGFDLVYIVNYSLVNYYNISIRQMLWVKIIVP
jgi:hypothetical protein